MIEIVKILQREDVKAEIKKLCVPFLEIVLGIINPYIYIILTLIFASFGASIDIMLKSKINYCFSTFLVASRGSYS